MAADVEAERLLLVLELLFLGPLPLERRHSCLRALRGAGRREECLRSTAAEEGALAALFLVLQALRAVRGCFEGVEERLACGADEVERA